MSECKVKKIGKIQVFNGMFNPFKFEKVENRNFVKGRHGLWTSSFNEDVGSDWIKWCTGEWHSRINNKYSFLQISENARIYCIDSYVDLAILYQKYGKNNYLDFEAISRDYDGIHLTEKGQWDTRISEPLNLYGWDCESTHWFNLNELKLLGVFNMEKNWSIPKY